MNIKFWLVREQPYSSSERYTLEVKDSTEGGTCQWERVPTMTREEASIADYEEEL